MPTLLEYLTALSPANNYSDEPLTLELTGDLFASLDVWKVRKPLSRDTWESNLTNVAEKRLYSWFRAQGPRVKHVVLSNYHPEQLEATGAIYHATAIAARRQLTKYRQ